MKIDLPNMKIFKHIKIPRPTMIWLVGMVAVVAGLEIAWIKNIIQGIYVSDVTKISVLIAIIFFWQSLSCGVHIWNQSGGIFLANNSDEIVEKGWLWSDIVLSLGMIGTVIGFMMMLAGFIDVDFSDFDSVQGLITRLSAGMATSLSTTLVGLMASVILKIQFFSLERVLINRKNESQIL
jgi:hypothetical protein